MDEMTCDPSDSAATVAVVDATLRRLSVERARNDHAICAWLVRADELQVERVFGYGSIREYAERVFGFGPRAVEDRLRVGRALRELPRLNAAFSSGELPRYTVVRELCRVATAETETEWIAAATGRTGTEVRQLVAAREPGERPSDPGKASVVPRRVTLTLSPEAYALLETARTEATRGAGGTVDDSAFVTEVVLAYLNRGGERDAGRAAFQIALTVDPHGGAVMYAGGETVAVDEAFVEMARCDAQHVGVVDGDDSATRATQEIPPRVRREVVLRHGRRCAVPGCAHHAFVHIHHVTPQSEGGSHDPDGLVLLCSNHHGAAHRGVLLVRGTFRAGFQFFHADGRPYGSMAVDATRAEVIGNAFEALRGLGFREQETRAMLDRIAGEVVAPMDLAAVVGLALKHADVSRVVGVREAVVPYARRPMEARLVA